VSLLTWASLGCGALTGKYRSGVPSRQAENGVLQRHVEPLLTDRSEVIVDHVAEAARRLDTTLARVTLAWLLGRESVASARA
jgi:aryl-alcohol dehydrogenase-like predicted oxidoreductase